MASLGWSKLSGTGETQFPPRHEVQQRSGKAVDLFIAAVESVAQIHVSSEVAAQAIVQVDTDIEVTRVPVFAARSAEVGFHIERTVAGVSRKVRVDLAVVDCREQAARLLRTPLQ